MKKLFGTLFLVFFFPIIGQAIGPYINNGDGTVSDQGTGLLWQQTDDNVQRTWEQALNYCNDLVLPAKGYTDWRLPNIQELQSIVDYTLFKPNIDPVFTGNVSYFWSSTSYAKSPDYGWIVNFFNGYNYAFLKVNYYYVRCVR